MALREKKAAALVLRKNGASYSEIKQKLGTSKSTLSRWLKDMPLSAERIRDLRGNSQQRIERYRATRHRAREVRLNEVRGRVKKQFQRLSNRELLIAGIFLYWGEGGKTGDAVTSLSNTDPAAVRFFIHWLELLGVPRANMRARLHLYSDMNAEAELGYWSDTTGLPSSAFYRPHIKRAKRHGLTYAQRFTHGTCNLLYGNRATCEYVLTALEYVRSLFARPAGL